MKVHKIKALAEMENVARAIGQRQGRDFSFLVELRGKVHRVVCEHVDRGAGRAMLGDIRPADRYRHAFPGQG